MRLSRTAMFLFLAALSPLSACKKSSPSAPIAKKTPSTSKDCKAKDLSALGLVDTRPPVDPSHLGLDHVGAYDLQYTPTAHTLVVYAFADTVADGEAPDYVMVSMKPLDQVGGGACPTQVNLGGAYYKEINFQADYPNCTAKNFMIKAQPCLDEGRSTDPATNCGSWTNATDSVTRIATQSKGDAVIQKLKGMQTLETQIETQYDAIMQPAVANLMSQLRKEFGDSQDYSAQVSTAAENEGGAELAPKWTNLYALAQNLAKNHSIFKAFLKSPAYEDLAAQAQSALQNAGGLQLDEGTGGCGVAAVNGGGKGGGGSAGGSVSTGDPDTPDTGAGTTGTTSTLASTAPETPTGTWNTANGTASAANLLPNATPASDQTTSKSLSTGKQVSLGIGTVLLFAGVAFFAAKIAGSVVLYHQLRAHLQGMGVDPASIKRITKFVPGEEISWEDKGGNPGDWPDVAFANGTVTEANIVERAKITVNGKEVVVVASDAEKLKRVAEKLKGGLTNATLTVDGITVEGETFTLESPIQQSDFEALQKQKGEKRVSYDKKLTFKDTSGVERKLILPQNSPLAQGTLTELKIEDGNLMQSGKKIASTKFEPKGWPGKLINMDSEAKIGWFEPRTKAKFTPDDKLLGSRYLKSGVDFARAGMLPALAAVVGGVLISNGANLTSSDLGEAFQKFSDATLKFGTWLDTQKPKIWQAHDDMVMSIPVEP